MTNVPSDGKWLWRYESKHWTDHLNEATQKFKFHSTLKPRLDVEIEDFNAQQVDPKSTPIYVEGSEPGATELGPSLRAYYDFAKDARNDSTD